MITTKSKGVHTKTGLDREFHVRAFTIRKNIVTIKYDIVLLNKTDAEVATILKSDEIVLEDIPQTEDTPAKTDYTDFINSNLGQNIITFIQNKI